VELAFQIGLLDLQALEFFQQKFAVSFRGRQLFFGIRDGFFKAANAPGELVGLLIQGVLLGLQFADASVAFGHFGLGFFGGGLGFFLGAGQFGGDFNEIV